MIQFRSLAFNLLFFTGTALMAVLGAPLLLAPRRLTAAYSRLWVAGAMALVRRVVGLDFEVRGREHLPHGPVVIAAKHQSAWDTLAFNLIVREPAFVLKRELYWVPLWGWYLRRFGAIAVDRSAGASALRGMVRQAKALAATGRPIVIFPEGTRTPPGAGRPYLPGVYALYAELDLPLVPCALNSGCYWPRRSFAKRPGRVVVEFLPALPPGLRRKEMMALLAERIEPATRALEAEATSPASS